MNRTAARTLLLALAGIVAALPATTAQDTESRREQPKAQMQRAERRMKDLSARAHGVIAAVDDMRERLRDRGLTLDAEIIAARSRMEQYLDAAEAALGKKNAEQALTALDRAEAAIRKLEARFGARQ